MTLLTMAACGPAQRCDMRPLASMIGKPLDHTEACFMRPASLAMEVCKLPRTER